MPGRACSRKPQGFQPDRLCRRKENAAAIRTPGLHVFERVASEVGGFDQGAASALTGGAP